MELKLNISPCKEALYGPLIEPYGIEISSGKGWKVLATTLLIEPYGIEIAAGAIS